jgi:hypothetical protein
MKQILVAVALVMVGLMPGVSQATTIFSDNFNGEVPPTGLNYSTFDNWVVSGGTVDLIGAGPPAFFNLLPGNGGYVDLDGSTKNAGDMTSTVPLFLSAGTTYDLTFDLAGSQRNDVDMNTLTYGIDLNGDGVLNLTDPIVTQSLANNIGFTPFLLTFTPSSAPSALAGIIFSHSGGDNRGLLLDNVALNSRAVPEPASLMLLGAGLAAIGIWRRKTARG